VAALEEILEWGFFSSKRWMDCPFIQSTLQYCLTFTRSYTDDGGVRGSNGQLVGSSWSLIALLRDTSTPGWLGTGPATFLAVCQTAALPPEPLP